MDTTVSDGGNHGELASESPLPLLERCLGDRYRFTQIIASGLSTSTAKGLCVETNQAVVAKVIDTSSLDQAALMRLEHEVSVRKTVVSDWIAPVLQVARHDTKLCVVSQYILGQPLQQVIREQPLQLESALSLAFGLFSALRDLHGQNILHGELRPSNIIVNPTNSEFPSTLVDLRTPHELDASLLDSESVLYRVRYMSPEQAGAIDHEVGTYSDLYSAGIILFHCLAGQPPFQGRQFGTILFEHMTAVVPHIRDIRDELPRALDELVQRLLKKDPQDRYQTASAVLVDLEAIKLAAEKGELDSDITIGAADRRLTLTQPTFVARINELAKLESHLDSAEQGQAELVFLEGESGKGKTRLLQEMAQRAKSDGRCVLKGQATADIVQQPFRLLNGMASEFIAAAESNPEFAESVRNRLTSQREAICSALPQLTPILRPNEEHQQTAPEEFGEERIIRALADFMEALGTAQNPALIIFDDCQWADDLALKLLQRWHRKNSDLDHSPRYSVILVAFRSEEVPQNHKLRSLNPSAHLRLSDMEPDDIRHLIESMAGSLPENAIDLVVRLANGSPFMASAVLRGLVETETLVATSSGWQMDDHDTDGLQSSDQAAAFLTQRIDLLPDDAVRLLTVGAVLGREFHLEMTASLASLSDSQAIAASDEARERHLVWSNSEGDTLAFVHDKIRATLFGRTSAQECREIHQRAAQYIQSNAPHRVSELAYHFDAAGDSNSALPFALKAAEEARALHSLDTAVRLYRIAERAQAARSIQLRIAEGLGDVLMLMGKYAEAAELFEQAATLADGKLAEAQVREKLAELAFKRGDKENATIEFENTLRFLGATVPRRLPIFVILLLWETFIQVAHTVLPKLFLHRKKEEPTEDVRLQLRLYSRLTHSYWFTRGKAQTLWTHLRGLNLGEVYPPTLELAHAYSEHAPVISLIPFFKRAVAYSKKSLAIREAFSDLWGQGQSLTFYGCVLFYSSQYEECIDKCRAAIKLLERMGDYWLIHIARYQLAASLYYMGNHVEAVKEAKIIRESGLELGDEQASGISLDIWARANHGNISRADVEVELGRDRQDAQRTTQVLLADGIQRLENHDVFNAIKTLESAVAVAKMAGIANGYTIPCLAWLATAMRTHAEQVSEFSPRQRARWLSKAARVCRKAIWESRICRNDLPKALREFALVSAQQGKLKKAQRLLDRSLKIANQQGTKFEYAQSLLAWGKIGLENGWQNSHESMEQANAVLSQMTFSAENDDSASDERETLSLVDRFDTVLDAGRKIASALSKPAIYSEVQTAALHLLRGEKCCVLLLHHDDQSLEVFLGDDNTQFDQPNVDRAIQIGRAHAFEEGHTDASSAAGGQRSAICVPILVRGQTVACVYLTHGLKGIFGAVERRLADFIGTIAGAALENAEGFEQLETLNITLEKRVEDRTAAAESRARQLASSNQELKRIADELRLTEEQLRIAIDEAEAANKAKSTFLANMSHEIRTPMNGVMGMTKLALQTELTVHQKRYLNIVHQSGEALLSLLNEILDLSKIEAGKMELETISMSPRDVAHDATRMLAVSAYSKQLELYCRIAPDVPIDVLGDPVRLRQIIVNLVGNAIKFTSEGEISVEVYVDHNETQEELLHFEVVDSGIGIPKDKQKSIFESFKQTDSSTTRRFGGTGLGLSISTQLVSLMGGKISVVSEEGQGSTFHFTIPLIRTSDTTTNDWREESLSKFKILLLCKQATGRRVYGELLDSLGIAYEFTASNQDAISAIKKAAHDVPVDLLIADVLQSQDDSSDASVGEVKLVASSHDCKLFTLIPANANSETCEWTEDHFLAKPVSLDDFSASLEFALLGFSSNVNIDESAAQESKQTQLKVLLVEDNPVNQEVALGLLEYRGHQVSIANNGKEALEVSRDESFDVILMDVEMPVMDGLEATRLIREREATTGDRIPIVAMTAHAVIGYREICMATGMDDYISKPIQPDELFGAIESLATKMGAT